MHHHPPEAALLDVNLSDGTTFALAASLQSMGIFYAFLPASDPADVPWASSPSPSFRKPASPRAVLATAHRLSIER
jgi:PleD family two-component response regulator